jgi:myo-inositol-1(or 4)-monophosphatase
LTFSVRECRALLTIAEEVASLAGDQMLTDPPGKLTYKGDRDITSELDVSIEQMARDFLADKTPEIGFYSEEQGGVISGDPTWVLDPIDGTMNFLHDVPMCAISLSLVENGITRTAVVDAPFLGLHYAAIEGEGAFLNGQIIRASATRTLDAALVSIDQPNFVHGATERNQSRLRLIERLASKVQRIRVLGTSALELAWTAHGKLDACIILDNKIWDTSAGVLLAREAGAHVVGADGEPHTPDSTITIAVAPGLAAPLVSLVLDTIGKTD